MEVCELRDTNHRGAFTPVTPRRDVARRGPVVSEKVLNRLSRHPGNAISPDDTELALLSPAKRRHFRYAHDFTPLGQAHSSSKLHLRQF